MRRALLLVALLLVASMQAQFQPTETLDPSNHTVREDLTTAGDLSQAQRVVRFVQVSDAHILDDDAPAPMRVEFLDQFGPPAEGAARPHEEYTDEILNAAIEQINQIHERDALDFVINTGDNIDNQLENELMRFIDNWEGTTTTIGPVSGKVCVPDGQSENLDDTANDSSDVCTHLPASVAENNIPLIAGLPWYSAFGNHDGLIQGNVPIEPSFNELASEFGRRFIDQEQYVDMHFRLGKCVGDTAGGDADDDNGHGYGFAGARLCDDDPDNDGYYAFTVRGVRFIVLDTVNDDFVTGNENFQGMFNPQTTLGYDIVGGYAEGSIDRTQFNWMRDEIASNSDKPVVLMAHHTVNSMFSSQLEDTCMGGQCLDDLLTAAGYVTGPDLQDELATHPNVLAFLGGHTHRHRIEAKTTDDGGFWNIETSALIDHPQEPRIIEIWAAPDGKWLIKTDPINHDFELGATLAASDPQLAATAEGEAKDQEVFLWSQLPVGVGAIPQPELPRVLQLRTDPIVGDVGMPYEFTVTATDAVRQRGVDGLNLTLDIGFAGDGGFNVVLPVGTAMSADGNGSYSVSFTPAEPTTHFATVRTVDPSGSYDETTQVFSIVVEGEAPAGKKSPSPLALGALAVFALVALRRR